MQGASSETQAKRSPTMTTRHKQLTAERIKHSIQRELVDMSPVERHEAVCILIQELSTWCDQVEEALEEYTADDLIGSGR